MIYLELFISFVKIGFTSFGGMSMIPLIFEEMQKHHWMNAEDLANLVAIAEMTPGPIGLNCATFAGTKAAGALGGLSAVAGVLMPAFTSALVVAVFFSKFKDNTVVKNIMEFVKPICIAMIAAVACSLGEKSYVRDGQADIIAIVIGILGFYLILKRKWSVPKVIGGAAVIGVLCYGVIGIL